MGDPGKTLWKAKRLGEGGSHCSGLGKKLEEKGGAQKLRKRKPMPEQGRPADAGKSFKWHKSQTRGSGGEYGHDPGSFATGRLSW